MPRHDNSRPPIFANNRNRWKTAYRVVQSFNRFKHLIGTNMADDEETRLNPRRRTQNKEPAPYEENVEVRPIDPVYLALKQATGKYPPPRRRPSGELDRGLVQNTPSPKCLSQSSLQDSGYGSTQASASRGLDNGRQLGSTPLLKMQNSIDEPEQVEQAPAFRRPPRLDKSMKSLSLDCPETSNPLSFSVGGRKGRPNPSCSGVVKRSVVGGSRLHPPGALRKNSSIDASADELDPRSSTSCSPCASPMQSGSTNSLPVNGVYVVTHEYRPQNCNTEEMALHLGEHMIIVDNGDPDWYYGCKQSDRTEKLITFPTTCVAQMIPGETAMKLVQNVSVSDGRRTIRLYRDQVVFAQPDSLSDGCVSVRSERNTKVQCPLQLLILLDF